MIDKIGWTKRLTKAEVIKVERNETIDSNKNLNRTHFELQFARKKLNKN